MISQKESIYIKSISNGIWQRPDQGAFAYSDGDEVEERISSTIAGTMDLSVLSMELQSKICDWPTNYHFSAERANLLRPLRSILTGSVLEIGSGCGAITRFLGETAAQVTALEGSPRRASITRQRTRDLSHVEVYCDEFSKFQIDQTFDAVTLIGVLEYANLFAEGSNPALKMLELAKQRLKNSGHLIIAIENKLGLKYFAGAPEDHLGVPLLGVENQYQPNGVRTYGKQELTTLLSEAGYSNIEFLYPFPDYKMPSCVLSEEALHEPTFDPTPFLVSSAGKDPQLPISPVFCMERVWPSLVENGVVQHLANSFLIVASNEPKAAPQRAESDVLAWHYSTQRQPQYCKETIFCKDGGGSDILIERRAVTETVHKDDPSKTYTHSISDETPYADFPLLSKVLINIATKDNWTFQHIADFIYLYVEQLSKICDIKLINDKEIQWDTDIPGKYLDCIPQNILLQSNGSCVAFDLEWSTTERLSPAYLVFRSLWHLLGGLSTIGHHANGGHPSILEIFTESIRIAGKDITPADTTGFVKAELAFLESVTGKPFDEEKTAAWLRQQQPRPQKVHQLAQQLARQHQLAHQLAQQLTLAVNTKNSELASHKQSIEELVLAASTREARHREELTHQRQVVDQLVQTASSKEARYQEELRETQLRLQQQSEIIRSISRETMNSNAAIRRLARNLTEQHLLRHSLKNLKKQALDYRNFLSTCDQTRVGSPWIRNIQILSAAARTHWSARPVVLICSRVESEQQAEILLKQTCHWTIPFEWNFSVPTSAIAEAISRVASELDIVINTSVSTLRQEVDIGTISGAGDHNSIIALPRTLRNSGATPATIPPLLPDSERVRLAYIALLTQQSLEAVYVGTNAAPQQASASSSATPLLCMYRSRKLRQVDSAHTFFCDKIDTATLKMELDMFNRGTIASY